VTQWEHATDECLVLYSDELPMLSLTSFAEGLKAGSTLTVTVGDVHTTEQVVALDGLGMIAQVGVALMKETISIGDIVVAFVKTDRPDGLYTTVVVDEQGVALGLVYSDDASIRAATIRRKGIYHSRRRGLWEKGLTSGSTQELLAVSLDCDRDALRYVVHQHGAGFCHLERRTCWCGDSGVGKLMRTLEDRVKNPTSKSYTNRLLKDTALLNNKLLEEAGELIEADSPREVAFECADVIYFAAVFLAKHGVSWASVETNLDNKSRRVRRRKGNAKSAEVQAQAPAARLAQAAITKVKEKEVKQTSSLSSATDHTPTALSPWRDLLMMSIGACGMFAVSRLVGKKSSC